MESTSRSPSISDQIRAATAREDIDRVEIADVIPDRNEDAFAAHLPQRKLAAVRETLAYP